MKKHFWKYECGLCAQKYLYYKDAYAHMRDAHEKKGGQALRKICTKCSFAAKKESEIFRHYLLEHKRYSKCFDCQKLFPNKQRYLAHLDARHACSSEQLKKCKDFCEHDNIFNRCIIKRVSFDPHEENSIEYMMYLKYRERIRAEMTQLVEKYHTFKVMFVTHCYFEKIDMDGTVRDNCVMKITSGRLRDFRQFDLYHFKSFLNTMMRGTLDNMEILELQGSGLVMKYITNFDIRICVPTLVGACRLGQNKLKNVKKFALAEKHLVDVSSQGEKCFLHAVAAGRVLHDHPMLAGKKAELELVADAYVKTNFSDKKKMSRFKFPFHIKDCARFEKAFSSLDLAINVWTISNESVYTLYQSKKPWNSRRIDLFLYQAKDSNAVGHYVTVAKVTSFLRVVKRHCFGLREGRIGRKWYYCDKCAACFESVRKFKTHVYRCKNPRGQRIVYARKGDHMSYSCSSRRQCKAPYIGFLDFEAKMSKVSNEQNYQRTKCDNCRLGGPVRNCNHSERELATQLPMTYSFYVFSSGGEKLFEKTYSSDTDVMADFFETLDKCDEELEAKQNEFKELHWTSRLEKEFRKATQCWICQGEFVPGDDNYRPVADHCHITPPAFNEDEQCLESVYLGAAHAICNLQRQSPKYIPIYVHNFMSYDSNFILKHLDVKGSSVKCMPYNSSKLRTLDLNRWKFLDSYQMLSGSLADLVNNLSQDERSFELVKQGLSISDEEVKLCTQKAAYPYEWVQSVEQLKNHREFPPYEAFYSELKGENISRAKYQEGLEIYESLKCKNMLEYTEFYCKLDTLLLAEVMFSFRETIYDAFELAIENFISLPQLSFEACLKTLRSAKLEKIADPAMVTMLEQNIRGGVSFVNNRHETVEDPEKECMLYIDANNLYGWAQKMYLPTGEYQWVPQNMHSGLDWLKMTPTQKTGYIAEVDLYFPPETHKKLDDLPLAPEHDTINFEKLSPYSQSIQRNILGKRRSKKYRQNKLVTSLEPKKRYVVHYLNLQLYLQLGAKITKLHNVMSFTQSNVLREFIEFASKMRAQSKTKFATDLWKRLSNSLYGKFIQDVRKYSRVVFVDNEKRLGQLIGDSYFKEVSKINQDLCMVLMQNPTLKLDRLYGIGFSILELSKFFMYKTWYDVIQPRFGADASLVLTDTDSFVVKFKNHSKNQALQKLSPIMDFSNFPRESPFFDDSVKKVPGYFKDEYPSGIIREAVNVRSKCYFLDVRPDPACKDFKSTSHVVCKGISHSVSSKFPIQLYKDCIYSKRASVYSTMHRIRAKKRTLHTTSVTKQVMSSGDDKRFQTCAIHSFPYGSVYSKIVTKKCIKCTRLQ